MHRRRRDCSQVDELVGVERAERVHEVLDRARVAVGEVVAHDEAAVVFDAAELLVELQPHESTVDAELDDVARDLVGDAHDHLGALQDRQHVAQRHEVFDLERRQRTRHGVEPGLVPLDRLLCLVRAVEQPRDLFERMLLAAHVDRDDRQILGHRDHRDPDRARHTLGSAVPGAGLGRRHVRVGHEVHVRPRDAARV